MPTYQYECDACGHSFEILQSMLDKKLSRCPACRENSLYRLIGSGSGIIFKGSGFYETDYKKKGPAAGGGGEGTAPAKEKSSDPGTTKETTQTASSGPEKADQPA